MSEYFDRFLEDELKFSRCISATIEVLVNFLDAIKCQGDIMAIGKDIQDVIFGDVADAEEVFFQADGPLYLQPIP